MILVYKQLCISLILQKESMLNNLVFLHIIILSLYIFLIEETWTLDFSTANCVLSKHNLSFVDGEMENKK
jgi:hypothetical protein